MRANRSRARILIPTREGGSGGLTPPGPHGRDERDLRRATADGRAPSEGWAFASQTARVLDAAKALRTSLRRNDALESSWRKPWTAAAVLGML